MEDKEIKNEGLVMRLHQEAMKEAAENRKNIADVKQNFEVFFREEIKFQADMKNSMNIISEQQNSLRNRFEEGTARTLRELKESFDDFKIQWGSKLKEDQVRDDKIKDAFVGIDKSYDHAEKAHGKYDWIIKGIIFVVLASILVGLVKNGFFGA